MKAKGSKQCLLPFLFPQVRIYSLSAHDCIGRIPRRLEYTHPYICCRQLWEIQEARVVVNHCKVEARPEPLHCCQLRAMVAIQIGFNLSTFNSIVPKLYTPAFFIIDARIWSTIVVLCVNLTVDRSSPKDSYILRICSSSSSLKIGTFTTDFSVSS